MLSFDTEMLQKLRTIALPYGAQAGVYFIAADDIGRVKIGHTSMGRRVY